MQYGAKTVPVGGYYSVPKLAFPGGMIIGDGANLFNSQKIKGIDLAMRSGMLAARDHIRGAVWPTTSLRPNWPEYAKAMAETKEIMGLYKVRNFHQAMTRGLYGAWPPRGCSSVLGGRVVSKRLPAKPDHSHMKKIAEKYGTAAPIGRSER